MGVVGFIRVSPSPCDADIVGLPGVFLPYPCGVEAVGFIRHSRVVWVVGFIRAPLPLRCANGGVPWVLPSLPLWCGGGRVHSLPLCGVEVVASLRSSFPPPVVWKLCGLSCPPPSPLWCEGGGIHSVSSPLTGVVEVVGFNQFPLLSLEVWRL